MALGRSSEASSLHQPGPWPFFAGDALVGLCHWTRDGTTRLKMYWSEAKQENKASSREGPSLNLSFCHSCLFVVKCPLVYEMVGGENWALKTFSFVNKRWRHCVSPKICLKMDGPVTAKVWKQQAHLLPKAWHPAESLSSWTLFPVTFLYSPRPCPGP